MVQDRERAEKIVSRPVPATRMVEDVIGCKWSLAVLAAINQGIVRPGAIRRSIPGLSTKILNERLAKMVRYRIVRKQSYPEIPPRVEYRLTAFGEAFLPLLDEVERLQRLLEDEGGPVR